MNSGSFSTPPQRIVSQLLEEDADLRDIVEQFVEALPVRLEELRQAHETLDWDQLTTLAHRLKGASGSYGYPDLSAIAAEMEKAFRAHSGDDCADWFARIEAYVQAAQAGLDG